MKCLEWPAIACCSRRQVSADGGPGVFGKSCVLLQSATLPTAASSTGRPGSLADGVSGSRPRDADSRIAASSRRTGRQPCRCRGARLTDATALLRPAGMRQQPLQQHVQRGTHPSTAGQGQRRSGLGMQHGGARARHAWHGAGAPACRGQQRRSTAHGAASGRSRLK